MNSFGLLLSLFFIVFVGFISGKAKLFDDGARKALAKFVFYIATSALIIESVLSLKISDLHKFPRFVLVNCVVLTVFYVLLYLLLRLSGSKYKLGASILFTGTTSNTIYLGIPFIRALYGNEGVLYLIAFLALPSTLGDIVGFYILSKWRKGAGSFMAAFRDFIMNPVVASTVIGTAFLLAGLRLPDSISSSLDYLGRTATGLALFAMGLYLSISSWRQFKFRRALLTTTIKLILMPAFTYIVARLVFGLTGTALFVTVMLAAMPSAIFCMIVASEYDFDERNTADSILLSSLLFLVTSGLWVFVLSH